MIWIQAKLKEVASLDGHVLLKKLRDALECLKGRLAGQNKEDVEKAISMVSFRFYAVMTLEICNMLTVCWLVSFLGRGFGSKINPKGRRADSREIRSEKASEFSQAGSLIYLCLYLYSSLHGQGCIYRFVLSFFVFGLDLRILLLFCRLLKMLKN